VDTIEVHIRVAASKPHAQAMDSKLEPLGFDSPP
jgi:hypothetical protein